jgi:hypothetical protein
VCFFFSSYVYFISSLLMRLKNDNNSRIIRMNRTPVTQIPFVYLVVIQDVLMVNLGSVHSLELT